MREAITEQKVISIPLTDSRSFSENHQIRKEYRMSRATNKYEASPRGSNLAYKALKPLAEARKDYVIVVAKRLIKEHGEVHTLI